MTEETSQCPLGASYSTQETTVRVWSPRSESVDLALYAHPKSLHRTCYKMTKSEEGIFEVTLSGDYHGYYYTFIVNGTEEVTDPYATASSANSARSAILNMALTNPEGWLDDVSPQSAPHTDAIIYELHIKDYTYDASSSVPAEYKGKYLGLTMDNTDHQGYATGLSHLVDLGVTHVHLMPIYDFISVDELSENDKEYNWGYDPELYNVPEGSYATNAQNPMTRITELKQLIMTLHAKGLKVVLDVVYNHTFKTQHSNFNTLAPNYYYRMTPSGAFSNGSGCGNEFASEQPMAQRFIIDSLCYWLKEYHVDGFRFDLMQLIDMDTLLAAEKALHAINPDVLIYGEPWMGGLSTLAEQKRLFKGAQCGKGFALFNDEFRDAIKGDNDGLGHGFIHGNLDLKYRTQIGMLGSIPFDQSFIGFAAEPSETINYLNSHDNLILFDKLQKTNPSGDSEDVIRLNKLAFNILLMSQGIPFIHEGNEFLRSKGGHHNTYNADIAINAIHWEDKLNHYAFYHYVRDLIEFRKAMPCFRMPTAEMIRERIKFYDHTEHIGPNTNVIAMSILGEPEDDYKCLFIVHNARPDTLMLSIAEIMSQLCKSYHQKLTLMDVEIHQIFDAGGVLHAPLPIDHHAHHLLRIPRYSSAVYQISLI